MLDRCTSHKDEQFSKASYPICVTLSGIVMEISDAQLENVLLPIDVTPSGIVKRVTSSSFMYRLWAQ